MSPSEVPVVAIDDDGGGGVGLGEGIADEGVEAFEVRPRGGVVAVGLDDLGLLDLVLLLGGVDAVLALDVGAAELGGVGSVDGVGDLLPVLLPEVAAVELEELGPPRVNQRPGCLLRPAVLAARENGGLRLRRRQRQRRWRWRLRREVGFRGGGRSGFFVVGGEAARGGRGRGGGGRRRRRGGLGGHVGSVRRRRRCGGGLCGRILKEAVCLMCVKVEIIFGL